MKTKSIWIIICACLLCGCSVERKIRFRPVSIYELSLNFKVSSVIYVNDFVNESHYQMNSFDVDLTPQELIKVESIDETNKIMEFSTYYLGRFYHLQLEKGEAYFLSTASFSTGKTIPLVYEKQQHYECPEQIAKQLHALSEK